MSKYCVGYAYKTYYEAVVEAKTKKEAVAKVKEVIGDDIEIEHTHTVRDDGGKSRG